MAAFSIVSGAGLQSLQEPGVLWVIGREIRALATKAVWSKRRRRLLRLADDLLHDAMALVQ
jgi:hypothetical protein